MEGWTKLLGFQVFNICKDHWTLQWKGLNLSSSVWVLKIASFEGSGYLGIDKTLGKTPGGKDLDGHQHLSNFTWWDEMIYVLIKIQEFCSFIQRNLEPQTPSF